MATYHDNHTIYAYTHDITKEQLHDIVQETINNIQKNHGICTKFRVNVVTNYENKTLGFSFIFLSNKEVYNILLGKNVDGTPRFKEKDIKIIDTSIKRSWADDLDDDNNPVLDDPLEKFNFSKYGKEPDVEYRIIPAFVGNVDDGYCPNVLRTPKIPEWVDENDLREHFEIYTSNPYTKYRVNIRGRQQMIQYPHVVITKGRSAFITFDINTKDAQFALHMNKKTELTKTINGKKHSVILSFTLSKMT